MGISNLTAWAKYLNDPLVLAGFVMMLVACISIILVKRNVFRLSKLASERILQRVIYCTFVLGLVIVVFSFVYALSKLDTTVSEKTLITQETKGEQSPNIITGTTREKGSIKQKSSGKQSPNIISNEKAKSVEINDGDPFAKKNKK